MPNARSLALLAALLPLAPAACFAAAATAAQGVNVRSGPATTYHVVGKLQQGDSVDVRQCEGAFCQIAFAGGTGWVSASFLTRDYVAPNQQVASAPSTQPLAIGQPSAESAYPPAYDAQSSDGSLSVGPPPQVPGASAGADMSEADAASAEAGATDVPRPRADIPGGPPTDGYGSDDAGPDSGYAPDDDYAAADGDDGPADNDFAAPPPGGSWADGRPGWARDRFRGYGRFGDRRDVAGFPSAGGEQACFLRLDGSAAFCLGDGEAIRVPPRWQMEPLRLHNPGHLTVAVCSSAAYPDCATYVGDGPILMSNRAIATIRVSGAGY